MRNKQHTPCNRKSKKTSPPRTPAQPPNLAISFTRINSNYPCPDYIPMVPTVLEPLKFYCIIETDLSKFRFVVLRRNLVPPFQRKRILQISEHKSLTSGPEGTATLCILLFKHPATPRGSKFLSHRKLIIICLIHVPPFYPNISDPHLN